METKAPLATAAVENKQKWKPPEMSKPVRAVQGLFIGFLVDF